MLDHPQTTPDNDATQTLEITKHKAPRFLGRVEGEKIQQHTPNTTGCKIRTHTATMAPTQTIALSLLSLLLALLPTTAIAQTSNSDFNREYNNTKKTVNGGMIAIIVVVVLFVLGGLISIFVFCCVIRRNRQRRKRQAEEISTANQKAAERRAREGGYHAAPQQEEGGLQPYQYGPPAGGYYHPAEMDAYQPPMEADSRERAKAEMP